MSIALRVLTDSTTIEREIMAALISKLNAAVAVSLSNIKVYLKQKIAALIKESPTYSELSNGDLGLQLGLKDIETTLAKIADTVGENIGITFNKFTNTGGGSLEIGILRSDYQDILSVPGVEYLTKNYIVVPWLNYLLTAGTTPIFIGLKLRFDKFEQVILTKSKTSFSISSEHAGTSSDNFLTRSLEELADDLSEVISKEIQGRI